jgi:hypothetical protein
MEWMWMPQLQRFQEDRDWAHRRGWFILTVNLIGLRNAQISVSPPRGLEPEGPDLICGLIH